MDRLLKNQVFPKQKGLIKTDIMGHIASVVLDLTSTYSSISGS